MKNKILLVFAGGTMAMNKDSEGALRPSITHNQIIDKIPELTEIGDIYTEFVTDIDSTNIDISIWNKIANVIADNYYKFDGFVVIHGTDTMAYTASALSFMLQKLDKPVIFTGSQLPIADKTRSEARSNLLHATHFACMDVAEVCIFFGSKLHRGNRAHKASQFDFDAFRSYNLGILGKVGVKPLLYEHRKVKNDRKLEVNIFNENIKIGLIKFFPGMKHEIISEYLNLGYDGLVVEGVGPGNLPTAEEFTDEIVQATNKSVPIVLVTQCEIGTAELDTYEVGMKAHQAGAISGSDMTTEAAIAKLYWVLSSNQNDLKTVREKVEKEIVGELSS